VDDNVGEAQVNIRRRDRGFVLVFCLAVVAVSSWLVAEAALSAAFARRQETNALLVREFSARAHLVMLQVIESSAHTAQWQAYRPQAWCARGRAIQDAPCVCAESDPSCLEISIGDARPSGDGIVRGIRIHSPALHPVLGAGADVSATLYLNCLEGFAGTCEESSLQLLEWQAL
jgi:hypothetical protein